MYRIKKTSFQIYETFKGSSRVPREEPIGYEPFLSSIEQKKGFVGKSETFRVSYKSLLVSY
jgi:hypothetical protein